MPSLCSLLYVTRALYYDHTDLDVDGYGNAVAQVFEKLVEQTPKDIQSCGRPVANVLFEKLTTDPIDTVRQLYKQFKLPFSSEYEKILKNYLQENYQQRELLRKKYPSQVMENDNQSPSKGLHKHQPEDWGLTAERLSQGAFAEYIKRYRL